MDISAVAFDLDGTLYPYSMMYRLSVPLFLRHPRFVYHFGRVRREIRDVARMTDLHATQAGLLALRMGLNEDTARRRIDRVIYRQWVEMLAGIRPFSDLTRELELLRRRGIALAVLSDYPVERKLGYLGLQGFFDCAFTSEDTGHLKPHPAPFTELAARLDLAPERILYVGDRYWYDITGAREAGMRTAFLGRDAGEADIRFRTYGGFADRVLSLGMRQD